MVNDNVLVCVNMLGYSNMSPNSSKNIPSNMEWIYLEYSILHLVIGSCSCSHWQNNNPQNNVPIPHMLSVQHYKKSLTIFVLQG
jgi:hypothetical protein